MSCQRWSEQLSAWIDGMLTESERRSLEAHLQSCETCRQTVEELRELKNKLQTIPVPSPKPEMWNRVMRHIRYRARRKRLTVVKPATWLAAAASTVLLLGAIALLWQKPTTSSPKEPTIKFIVSYHADTVSLGLSDNPLCHLIATAELSEAEGHE